MPDKKTINYSSTDIERYHKGLMTAKEMNALEKAALDDPFLSDALEGYGLVPVDAQADISLLNKRLEERISDDKIVPVRKLNFTWLRVAALFIIIAGAGLLTYNYVFNKSKQDVAVIEKTDTTSRKIQPVDTARVSNIDSVAKTLQLDQKEKLVAAKNDNAQKKEPGAPVAQSKSEEKKGIKKPEAEKDIAAPDTEKSEDVAINGYAESSKVQHDSVQRNFSSETKKANAVKLRAQDDIGLMKDKNAQSQFRTKSLNETAVSRGITTQNNKINYFRGRITDNNNSPLPFANVTIVPDNIGTYTDAKGNFVLISPDSVLEVKVRSVGFENDSMRLFTNLSSNSIVLQQDTKDIPATVLNNKKINTQRRERDNVTVEEPEPADGWINYDVYLSNNIQISDKIKTEISASSEVELSFEVNKLGEPVNVKVEKSVCKECDAEAIRLLKDGPKWKNNNKNKRAKILVGFSPEQ